MHKQKTKIQCISFDRITVQFNGIEPWISWKIQNCFKKAMQQCSKWEEIRAEHIQNEAKII